MIRLVANDYDLVSNDVIGVLSPSQQLDSLRVAVGDKLQFVFHDEGRVQVVRVDGDTHEREEAVASRDGLVVKLGAVLAIEVESVRRTVAAKQANRTDVQVAVAMVVDFQLVRGRAQRGEHCVEQDRVSREAELQVGVVTGVMIFPAGGKRYRQQGEYKDDM